MVVGTVRFTRINSCDLVLSSSERLRSALNIKGVAHHEFKVSIRVNVHRNCCVVFQELLGSHIAIGLRAVYHIVVRLKCFQKFVQNLLFSALARLNVRVAYSGVNTSDIINRKYSISSSVKLLEYFENDVLAVLVHGAFNSANELVEANRARLVSVDGFENTLDIFGVNFNAVVVNCFLEFVFVKLAITRVIHDAESAAETHQAS
jgi:hypothetical protein